MKTSTRNTSQDTEALSKERTTLYNSFMNAPSGIAILKGENHIYEFVNASYEKLVGRKITLGKTLQAHFREIEHQGHLQMVKSVFLSGEPHSVNELPVELNSKGDGILEKFFLNVSIQPLKDNEGNTEKLLVHINDVTESVNARKQIEESNHQLNFAIEAMELGTWDYNPITNKFISNNRLKDWFGLPHAEEIDLSVAINAMAEKDRSRVSKMIQRALEDETLGLYDIEYTILNSVTKQERIVRAKGKAWFGDDKKPYRLNGTLQDITQQTTAKTEIEKTASYLKLATDSANVGTWSLEMQTQELEWSALHKKMWGYDEHRTNLTYEDWHKLILPEDKEKAFGKVEDARVSHTPYQADYYIKRADDGALRYMRSYGKYHYNDKGEAETLTGISFDITDQKEAELKLKASEEKYRGLFATMDQGFCIIEIIFDSANKPVDYLFVEANPMFEMHSGITKPVGKTIRELVSNMEERWFEVYGKVALTGEATHFIEHSSVLDRWFDVYAFRLEDQGSNKVAVLFTDITDRKQAEKKIKDSETLFRTFADSIPNLAWIANGDGRIYWYNKQWYDYTGTGFEEMEGFGWQKVHHPDHVKNIIEVTTELWKKDEAFELTFPLRRHDGEYRWFLTRVYPILDAHGNIERWIGTNTDITERIEAEGKLLKSEQQMQTIVETAPFPIGVYIGKEMTVQFANQSILDIWGKGNDVIGKSFKQILPELDSQEIFKQLDAVYSTGIPYHTKNQKVDIITDGKTTGFYFNYSFTPLADADGKIYGVMNTAADVTDLNLAKLAIQKSEGNLRSTILQAPVAMCIFKGENFIVDLANDRMFELWGKPAAAVMHKPIFEALPETKNQGLEAIVQGVYTTGKTFSADGVPITLQRNGAIELVYVNFVYEPYRESDGKVSGILAVAVDVTAQLTASKKIEEREQKFRLLADSMPQLIWTGDTNGNLNYFNQSVYDYSDLREEDVKKEGGWMEIVHPDEREENIKQWLNAVSTGNDFKFEHRFRRYDGEYRWQLSRAKPQLDDNGNIQMWVGTSTDIQDQKDFAESLETEVRERTQQLQLQNQTFKISEKIAKFGSYKWNINKGSLEYSDNLFRLFDYEPQEFVPSFDFFLSFIHPDDLQQVIKNGEETMQTGRLVETPYRIISKTGKIKHFRSSGSFTGEDNNRTLIGTVQDITRDIEAAQELSTKNLELEITNDQLASFTYAASHDLQEPLRKIQTFAKRIIEVEEFSVQTQHYFSRIISSAERMQNLIISLLDFSRADAAELNFSSCDLNAIVEESKSDLNLSIVEKQAIIEYENLPTLNGLYVQLCQLFTNLIDNGIKYSRPNTLPHIKVSSERIAGAEIGHPAANKQMEYYAIKIEDNGIGFENEYAIKIFELFQRLHLKHEYSGTGIGLAIVKKIVTNHKGFILAEGHPGAGSVFTIYIPAT